MTIHNQGPVLVVVDSLKGALWSMNENPLQRGERKKDLPKMMAGKSILDQKINRKVK